MKINRKKLSNTIHGANGRSGITGTLQLVEFTFGQMEEMRRLELNRLRKQYGSRGQRVIREVSELDALIKLIKGANFAEVGVFFYWDSLLLVSSPRWKLNPVAYGFYSYPVSHRAFWKSLQDHGKVRRDITMIASLGDELTSAR